MAGADMAWLAMSAITLLRSYHKTMSALTPHADPKRRVYASPEPHVRTTSLLPDKRLKALAAQAVKRAQRLIARWERPHLYAI